MNEEKSMVEYKEQKGIFQWLKSKFEKLIEKFRPTQENPKKQINEQGELSVEQLDDIRAGVHPNAINFEEKQTEINNLEPKPWELTEQQMETVEQGYTDIRTRSTEQEKDLSEEELDKITAGQPRSDDNEYIQ